MFSSMFALRTTFSVPMLAPRSSSLGSSLTFLVHLNSVFLSWMMTSRQLTSSLDELDVRAYINMATSEVIALSLIFFDCCYPNPYPDPGDINHSTWLSCRL